MPAGKIDRVYSTDVLAVGGGGAGITAAVAAAEQGAKVALVSKGKIGNSGNTIMIGGSFAMDGESAVKVYGIKDADPSYTKDHVFESIVRDGFFLSDQNLVEQFVDESPEIVHRVCRWGEKAGQTFLFGKPATWVMTGRAMGRALLYGLRQAKGVETFEDIMLTDLLEEGGRVCGALGFDVYTGEPVRFNASAVVLGTGGFQPFSLKNTNSDMTGDGVAMAFRAGAKVADMEFLLFLLTALEPREIRGSILPIMFMMAPELEYTPVDVHGREIVVPEELKKIEKTSELCKLIHLYYYGRAVARGDGTANGGIYFDFSRNSPDRIGAAFDEIIEEFSALYRKGFYHGDSLEEYRDLCIANKRMEVGLGNEYSVGGILINERMETTVPGLYAAGECTSGTFGANRVADAVVEMIVQGTRAGRSASGFARNNAAGAGDAAAKGAMEKLEGIFENRGGISAAEANRKIEEISDRGLGFFRTEAGLSEALAAYDSLEKDLDTITLKNTSRAYNFERIQALQAKNRLLCSKLAARMALERKESRGLHLRSDYPEVDNADYLVRTIAGGGDGGTLLEKRPPVVTRMPLPAGSRSDFIRFMLENDLGMENVQH